MISRTRLIVTFYVNRLCCWLISVSDWLTHVFLVSPSSAMEFKGTFSWITAQDINEYEEKQNPDRFSAEFKAGV